jgi:hypothetical protein
MIPKSLEVSIIIFLKKNWWLVDSSFLEAVLVALVRLRAKFAIEYITLPNLGT